MFLLLDNSRQMETHMTLDLVLISLEVKNGERYLMESTKSLELQIQEE